MCLLYFIGFGRAGIRECASDQQVTALTSYAGSLHGKVGSGPYFQYLGEMACLVSFVCVIGLWLYAVCECGYEGVWVGGRCMWAQTHQEVCCKKALPDHTPNAVFRNNSARCNCRYNYTQRVICMNECMHAYLSKCSQRGTQSGRM